MERPGNSKTTRSRGGISRTRFPLAAIAALGALLLAAAGPAGAGAGYELLFPSASDCVGALAIDPDGNFWLPCYSSRKLMRIDPDGTSTRISVPSILAPRAMAWHPAGFLVTMDVYGNVWSVTTGGVTTPLVGVDCSPKDLTIDADGGIWAITSCSNQLWRVGIDGSRELINDLGGPEISTASIAVDSESVYLVLWTPGGASQEPRVVRVPRDEPHAEPEELVRLDEWHLGVDALLMLDEDRLLWVAMADESFTEEMTAPLRIVDPVEGGATELFAPERGTAMINLARDGDGELFALGARMSGTVRNYGIYSLDVAQDADGDGVPDDLDLCPGQDDTVVGDDTDEDGIPDCLDGLVFSTATTQNVFGSGTVLRNDINEIAPLSTSIDVLASFLPWNSNLDAVDRRSDGELLFSVTPTTFVSIGGVLQVLRQDVVYGFAGGLVSKVLDPNDFGLSLQTLDAIDALDDGSYAVSVSQSRWVLHAGGVDHLQPWQVWRLIPLGATSATLELLADLGPLRVRDVNGVDVLPDGRIAITSAHREFVALPGLFSIWPYRVYIWDGSTLSLSFDGQDARLRDLDAISLVDAEAEATD